MESNFKDVQVISGEQARRAGYYKLAQFIIDGDERDYDSGLWLINGEKYAQWYQSPAAMAYSLINES